MPNVDIILRIESAGAITDMPSSEKDLKEPKHPKQGRVKSINVPEAPDLNIRLELNDIEDVDNLTRLDVIEAKNRQVIAGANFILAEVAERMKGKDVVVDPAKHTDVIDSMNRLFGTGHDGKISFAMYQQLKEFIYDYGRLKTVGATGGTV